MGLDGGDVRQLLSRQFGENPEVPQKETRLAKGRLAHRELDFHLPQMHSEAEGVEA